MNICSLIGLPNKCHSWECGCQIQVDTGKGGNNQLFEEGVQKAFAVEDKAYNMNFTEEKFLNDL